MDVVLSILIICATVSYFVHLLFLHLAIKARAKAKLIEAAAEVVTSAADLVAAAAIVLEDMS